MSLNTKCNACSKIVHEEGSICCSFCCTWIHLKCSRLSNYEKCSNKCSGLDKKYLDNIEYSNLLENWQCPTCRLTLVPLASLNDEDFFDFFFKVKNS